MRREVPALRMSVLAVACVTAYAQAGGDAALGVDVALAGTVHDAFYGLAFDGAAGVAVGARGEVAISEDGGNTWTMEKAAASDVALLGVAIHGARRMAVGQSGRILIGERGAPWTAVSSGTDQRLFAVDFNAAGIAVAAGAFGTVLVSTDGGRAWSSAEPSWTEMSEEGMSPHLYDAHVDAAGVITLAGEFGMVLRTADRGVTWSVLHRGVASIFDIEVLPDSRVFAVGQEGTVLRSTDGGRTWSQADSSTQAILLGVSATSGGRVVACGMRTLLVSENQGMTWQAVSGGDIATNWYQKVKALDGDRMALLAGHSGRIVHIGRSRSAAVPNNSLQEKNDEGI